jgi:hypothetical protein
MKWSSLLSVLFSTLLAAPAFAQDPDAIGLKCAQSKLRAAGKECSCVHKEWSRAVGLGELPDLSKCEEKLTSAFVKAEQRASDAGGACLAGEPVGSVLSAIAAAADKTLTQVGRGTITPAPVACDSLYSVVAYSGGNYANMRKCVKLNESDTDCLDEDTLLDFVDVLKKDFKCPACPAEEDGCFPRVSAPTLQLEMRAPGVCCMKEDATDSKKSATFQISCTLCIAG